MDTKIEPATRMSDLLKETHAYVKNEKYVYFDRIWQNLERLKQCANIIYDFLAEIDFEQNNLLLKEPDNLVIVCPEVFGGSIGIIPVSFFVAEKIGCQVAIWKELADVKWATSTMVGCTKQGINCILMQDVVDEGTTAIKVTNAIKEKELNWKFKLYFAIVLNNLNNDPSIVKKTLSMVGNMVGNIPQFSYILSSDKLS